MLFNFKILLDGDQGLYCDDFDFTLISFTINDV